LPPVFTFKTAIRTFSLKLKVRDFGDAESLASAGGLVLRNLACPKAGPARIIAMAAAGNQYLAMIDFSNGLIVDNTKTILRCERLPYPLISGHSIFKRTNAMAPWGSMRP
jgi:hypothetical protein